MTQSHWNRTADTDMGFWYLLRAPACQGLCWHLTQMGVVLLSMTQQGRYTLVPFLQRDKLRVIDANIN